MKAKRQRLIARPRSRCWRCRGECAVAFGAKDQAAFFYAPGDVKKDGLPIGPRGSARRDGRGRFDPATCRRRVDPLRRYRWRRERAGAFKGIAPDLFREKSGVVAEGSFNPDGSFTATNLLAKHDEKYMPPEIAGKMHETKTFVS